METLAIVTRVHPERPNMLRRCVESVNAQEGDGYIHILHRHDKSGRGYGKWNANKSLAAISDIPAKYVMVLDDDDMLIKQDFVREFSGIVDGKNPEIVFFKGNVHKLGVLPRPAFWKRPPVYGQIASFCLAVRHDVWMKHIKEFGRRELGGDFCFISACYRNTKDHLWWDVVVAATQKGPGRAKGERDHA
jgi:glycosyltransferase involved in cell wall biosynthesis